MAPLASGLSHLSNLLATSAQLAQSASSIQGVPRELEESIRYASCVLIQNTGILLRLPQQLIAETIVIFCRFWIGSRGGSLLDFNAKDVAAASLYLVTKPGPYPLSPRQVLNTFFYATHVSGAPSRDEGNRNSTDIPLYSEGEFEADRAALVKGESQILKVLGFQTHVALPHGLCINYLQTLDAFEDESGQDLARRAWAHLNSALFSPQLIYLTHQPNALATAAIYLGAREVDFNLPTEPWWEVFDVDREELGFLVVAMTSQAGFVDSEMAKYSQEGPPLTTRLLKEEIHGLTR